MFFLFLFAYTCTCLRGEKGLAQNILQHSRLKCLKNCVVFQHCYNLQYTAFFLLRWNLREYLGLPVELLFLHSGLIQFVRGFDRHRNRTSGGEPQSFFKHILNTFSNFYKYRLKLEDIRQGFQGILVREKEGRETFAALGKLNKRAVWDNYSLSNLDHML